jgi:hypothetical protein
MNHLAGGSVSDDEVERFPTDDKITGDQGDCAEEEPIRTLNNPIAAGLQRYLGLVVGETRCISSSP